MEDAEKVVVVLEDTEKYEGRSQMPGWHDVKNESFALNLEAQQIPIRNQSEEFFRNYNFKTVERVMRNAWNPLITVEMHEVEPNLYLTRFTNRLDLNIVLRCGPWRFNDYLLATKEIEVGKLIPKKDLHFVDFWLHIYGISKLWQLPELARYVGNLVRKVVEVDDSVYRRDVFEEFMRARVTMDVNVRFPRGTCVELGAHNVMLAFKYELPYNFCFWCGKISHVVEECIESLKQDFDITKCAYGEWLKGFSLHPNSKVTRNGSWTNSLPDAGNPFARTRPGLLLQPPTGNTALMPGNVQTAPLGPPPGFQARPSHLLLAARPQFTAGVPTFPPGQNMKPKTTYKKRGPKPKNGQTSEPTGTHSSGGSDETRNDSGSNKKKRSAEMELVADGEEVQFFEHVGQV